MTTTNEPEFNSGDRVTIEAVIERVDREPIAGYRVELPNGYSCWFKASDLQPVAPEPAPKALTAHDIGQCLALIRLIIDQADPIVPALATPSASNDGLPEGWKANSARRDDGATVIRQSGMAFAFCRGAHSEGPGYETVGHATMSLSDACLAANERFPVAVKPEAPASNWVLMRPNHWARSDGFFVGMTDFGLWGVFQRAGVHITAAFPTAEEAMAWADRERPVA